MKYIVRIDHDRAVTRPVLAVADKPEHQVLIRKYIAARLDNELGGFPHRAGVTAPFDAAMKAVKGSVVTQTGFATYYTTERTDLLPQTADIWN